MPTAIFQVAKVLEERGVTGELSGSAGAIEVTEGSPIGGKRRGFNHSSGSLNSLN